MAKYLKDLNILKVVGGEAKEESASRARAAPQHIVVGTPGRVQHFITEGILKFDRLRMFILDEADEMLSRGFKDAIVEINSDLPKNAQTILLRFLFLFFIPFHYSHIKSTLFHLSSASPPFTSSATMPSESVTITTQILRNPVRILVPQDELTLDGLKQFYVAVEREEQKMDVLLDIYESIQVSQCVMFCNTRRKVDFVTHCLRDQKYTVSCIHSKMSQDERNAIMQSFREGKSRVLISTDLLSRGIDVQQISLVVNFDLPTLKESYIHRIGRSARFGRKGIAINLVTTDDGSKLKEIQEFYHTQIDEMPVNIKDLLKA
jgi:translation initiation factor 4A